MKKYTHEELKNLDPVEYAKQWNASRNAQAEAEGWQAWSLLPEDREYYEDHGYESAYDYELDCAKQVLSDVYKEINGFRPRGVYRTEDMSLAAVEDAISELYAEEKARKEAQREYEEEVARKVAEVKDSTSLTFNPFANLKEVC